MNLKYRIRYRMKEADCVEDIEGVSPISALNQFHRNMQLSKVLAPDRKTVLRPYLKPTEYSVLSIYQVYNTDPAGRQNGVTVESGFDLPPGSRNPDLVHPHVPSELADGEMPFMKELGEGRLAQ